MVAFEKGKKGELETILRKAVEFHGHLGPFVVIGARMGLIGVRELGAKRNDERLRVTAWLKDSVPFSCVIDGIQVATNCTIGNKKLRLRNSSGIAARFKLRNEKQVTFGVHPAIFERMKDKFLSENVPTSEMHELAQIAASMPEDEMFIIEGK